jgi:hypothetical protein
MAATQEFRVEEESQRDHLIAIGASAFFLIFVVGALWKEPQFRTAFGFAISAAALAFLAWTLVREVQALRVRKNWPVLIDEKGVHYASPGQIAWTEIAGLEPRQARQCVDLRDAEGRVRVSLPYDLEDAHEVVQFVADMLSDRWPKLPLPHAFSQELPRRTVIVAAVMVVALGWVTYLMRHRPLIELLCAIVMLMLIGALAARRLSSVRRLTVGKQDLTVTKGLRSRVFNYADIQSVGLVVVGGSAERRLDVKVTFNDKSASNVMPWQCDPFDVYATVKAAWEGGHKAAAASATPAAAS